ncbi:MAG: hypothetical protein CMG02_02545 [Candidatus Marinimicrobia bacterium]|nr:hypothetical protein [Candidatus Neomarinimicrobiota bacterium]RPG06034.1 MAG: hypothetical protein CBE07_000395 [Pelagibacteraceae bacterium TMED247]|tara:strand:- start:2884 stop:4533 length:1650 start_codon:yes stop_codon:yes gene_type:complete
MLDLKNVYLYFSSIKRLILKSLKEFFFLTNLYNRSLNSQIPARLFFQPNPYLLTSLFNYESFIFKISKESIYNFWNKNLSSKEKSSIHNFLWLNLIDRKNEKEIIQRIINDWINQFNNYKKDIWKENIISKRIIAWLSNSDIILNNTKKDFEKKFLNCLIRQVNFLKKNLKTNTYEINKISSLSAIILSGLVFKEYYSNYTNGMREIKKLIDEFFDEDGFPKNRNLENLIVFLQYFVLIKEWTKSAQENVPEYLEEIIRKNLVCLNSFKNSNKKIPLFNGATEREIHSFLEYLEKLNYRTEKKLSIVGKIQILENKKTKLFFDSGEPPEYKLSRDYQSGPLSFEYFSNDNKIITNCGYGRKISKKIRLISKLTSAQSTLCLNDISVVKFKKNNLINKVYGSTIDETFKISEEKRVEDKSKITISATHNAYLKNFGYLHKREINFLKKESYIKGIDTLLKKNDTNREVNFSIRFHIYPGLDAFRTVGGSDILLQVNKNNSYIFSSKNQKLEIEKSLFLGRNKILNNNCIVIYGKTKNQDEKIEWELKKAN